MLKNFEGRAYRLVDNWLYHVPLSTYASKPINYLEVGTYYGANIISFANTYGIHPESKLYCIDPWEDYDEYPEYKGEQEKTFQVFSGNIERSGQSNKIVVKRGYSNIEIPKFPDNHFDIIYIDGNHESEYVLEDAVLSFRKLKIGGILVFDDYGHDFDNRTERGINAFLSGFRDRIKNLGERDTQLFVEKIR